uniref:4'-phosphopantetheinyl transferase superfamily protein n=1 Tax=Candidatus Cyanaurora vandensis TaxID=2714958 RepID=UPI002580179C
VRVGVDIERADVARAADWYQLAFNPTETALLQPGLLVAGWCAKEAVAKATGLGLHNPAQWLITQASDQGLTVQHAGIAYPVQLWSDGAEVLALCQFKCE